MAAEVFPVLVTKEMIISRDWERRQGPFYRVEEVAKVFFGMSSSWLRLKMKPDKNHPDTWFVHPAGTGEKMTFSRNIPGKTDSSRVFTLADIQPMAESLYEFSRQDRKRRKDTFSRDRLGHVLAIVRDTAVLYELIESPQGADWISALSAAGQGADPGGLS